MVRVTNVLGYQTQELLGKTAFDFYHPEDVADMKENFERGAQLFQRCFIDSSSFYIYNLAY